MRQMMPGGLVPGGLVTDTTAVAAARGSERPVSSGAPLLLEVRHVDAGYGPLQVLFGVNLTVPVGGQVAVLGTNGAGKSTLLRVIGGLVPADRGEVLFKGEDVTRLPPHQRVRRGLAMVEGGRATFPGLTVEENVRLGAYPWLTDRRRVNDRLVQVLELFPVLGTKLRQTAGTLSGGEQQMMALGRGLMADPELLLVDELSLGLAPVVLQQLVHVVDEVAASGRTIVLVEQSLNVALTVARHAYFMEKGEVRFSGPTAELVERGDLVRSVFFGGRDS